MNYELPTSVRLGGKAFKIRSDFRAVLDIFTALSDPELSDQEKILAALEIFYVDFDDLNDDVINDAVAYCMEFINGGHTDRSAGKSQKLIDWDFDFQYIISPVNRIIGKDVRGMEYMHWWTFLSAFQEIGDCTLAQIVRIRSLKSQGKLKDKADIEWYKKNRDIVDIPTRYTEAEQDLLRLWGGK